MFDEVREKLIKFFTSRLTVFTLVFLILAGILVYRCFELQIVQGQKYLDEFILKTEKTRDLSSTRGNIYDRNGNLLAYNELAYSVKIEDVFESGSSKNKNLNETILRLIQMLEKNGDSCITDFKIYVDEDGEFSFSVDGTARLRFIADVYGIKTIDKLEEPQKRASALTIMEYLSRNTGSGFSIGEYEDPENRKSTFYPGKGYTNETWLKLVTIRYAMSLTSYRKYIGTTVANNVSEKTVAVIMENSTDLPGVSIVEDTVRKYVDSKYFAHVLGYTGKISSDELTQLNLEMQNQGREEDAYNINDVVGKSGIESYLETTLHGAKGYERVVVDNMGKVISIEERKEAQSGQDVYLTIDKELTKAAYNIVEQKLAGLVASKIVNQKQYVPAANAGSADIKIPIYDVYYTMFNNSIIDFRHLSSEYAGSTEKEVFQAYLEYKEKVYAKLTEELVVNKTPYNRLTKEYQVYESNIVSLLNKNGIIISSAVDTSDKTYIAWTTDEVISLNEYLHYCIAQNWIDVSRLELGEYSDSSEIYDKLLDYIIAMLDRNTEFQKKFFKYMLLSDVINGNQVCRILCEQGIVDIPMEDETALFNGRLSAYQFMMNRIKAIDITPAQLALDPCNASVVITDVNSGEVLALVSYPGYDNNKMANSIDAEYYAKLITDKSMPQYNFATQSSMAPGSTFKMVSASAGLMEGVITLHSKINCVGTFTMVTPSPRCWNRWGHGNENVTTAIRDSCNYYFYNLGYELASLSGTYSEKEGLNILYKYADMFGLSEKSGIEISETQPNVSTEDSVRSAIGQGTHSYTTVGLARYVSTVANRGTCYNLTLIDKITDSEGNIIEEYAPKVRNIVDMPKEYWDAIQLGMRQVVMNKSYFSDLAVEVAGKTGTAEQTKSRPNHALFVCYAPYEEPELAIATRIPYGYSSDYAAQTTRDIIKYYYGLAEKDDLINGIADEPDSGISNEL